MRRNENAPVRKIVKKVQQHAGHHGGAWKVAYADFVTTMMALFIVLWIIGQSDQVKKAIAEYFRDPGAFRERAHSTLAPAGAGILPSESAPSPERERDLAAEEEARLQQAAREARALLDRAGLPQLVREQIRIEITAEGLRFEMSERDNSNFFRVGSAEMIQPLRMILEHLQKVLVELPNPITIEGHTDSRRYAFPLNYSNWELSADRANSARRVLEATGLPEGRIDQIVGHADRLLLVGGDPLNASNRRITILVRRLAGQPAARRLEDLRGARGGTDPASRGARGRG